MRITSQAANDPVVVHDAIELSDERMQRWSSGGITIIEIMYGGMAMIVLRNGVLINFEECGCRVRLAGGAHVRRSYNVCRCPPVHCKRLSLSAEIRSLPDYDARGKDAYMHQHATYKAHKI